jgi:hypothetical protein
VKAPRTWPKNSLSNSSPGTAPQLTFTKARSRRGLFSCTARATSSLPTPVSPRISTGDPVGATSRICSITRRMPGSAPTMSPKGAAPPPGRRLLPRLTARCRQRAWSGHSARMGHTAQMSPGAISQIRASAVCRQQASPSTIACRTAVTDRSWAMASDTVSSSSGSMPGW